MRSVIGRIVWIHHTPAGPKTQAEVKRAHALVPLILLRVYSSPTPRVGGVFFFRGQPDLSHDHGPVFDAETLEFDRPGS